MQKDKLFKKGSAITVFVIIALAFAGLLFINSNDVTAENNSRIFESLSSDNGEILTAGSGTSSYSAVLKMISALVIVIACIYFSMIFIRKGLGKKFSSNQESNILEVLETTYLSPKKTVSLLRVAGKSVLIGITETQISVLAELGEEETAKLTANIAPQLVSGESSNFKNIMEKVFDGIKKSNFGRRQVTAESR